MEDFDLRINVVKDLFGTKRDEHVGDEGWIPLDMLSGCPTLNHHRKI